jgi:hypothetical protein
MAELACMILSLVGGLWVRYKTGSELDDWIY